MSIGEAVTSGTGIYITPNMLNDVLMAVGISSYSYTIANNGTNYYNFGNFHGKRSNILYCDGHVAATELPTTAISSVDDAKKLDFFMRE